jgi:hypothetical protein
MVQNIGADSVCQVGRAFLWRTKIFTTVDHTYRGVIFKIQVENDATPQTRAIHRRIGESATPAKIAMAAPAIR